MKLFSRIKCYKIFFLSLVMSWIIIPTVDAQSASKMFAARLANFKSMQADFFQTIVDKNGNILQKSQGKMALVRPGLFRWNTLSPNQQLIVADRKTIWIYDKDLQQVTKHKQNNSADAPGLLLSDSTDHIIARFNITNTQSNSFTLTPKGKKDLFQSVTLVFDANSNNHLNEMALHDNLGQTTQILFRNIKINENFNNHLFQFSSPKNVDVLQ